MELSPAAGQLLLGMWVLLPLLLYHLYLEQSLDRWMPHEEQVLREKMARLGLSQGSLHPVFPPRLPGSQQPGLSSLQISSSLEGHWLSEILGPGSTHWSQLVGWGRGEVTGWLRKVALARVPAGSHVACLHCPRQVS